MVDQAEVFLQQAGLAEGRSPLYAAIWRRLAEDPEVAEIIGEPTWDSPLRLAAGLHYLVLSGEASWDETDEALTSHRDFLSTWVARQGVQTNEVQRCWMLLPCFLRAAERTGAREFRLVEIGPAAGLNLVWDRYRYSYADGDWGLAAADLALTGEERRPVPTEILALRPVVRSRVGIEINPIDVLSDEGALLLKSFVWADQTWRLDQLDRAIAAVRRDPPDLIDGDAASTLPTILAEHDPDVLTVVWQTAVLGYLPAERRQLVRDALEQAGATRPLAYVEAARPSDGSHAHYGLWLQLWPGGSREELALAEHHGAWLDWIAT